jgi:uncharacterized damage-inducible protein DinB
MRLPEAYEYPKTTYFAEYLNFEPEDALVDILKSQQSSLLEICQNLNKGQENFAYAPGKWSIQQLIGHIIDTERIFSYRALAISRGEKQMLPGFDENEYLVGAQFESQSFADILTQYRHVRQATISLIESFSTNQANQMGHVNGNSVSVRALSWMIAGHEKHHIQLIKERYLSQNP